MIKFALFLCFVAVISATNQDCEYQFENMNNAVFSLQASVNSEDMSETQSNLNYLFNVATLIDNFCASSNLNLKPQRNTEKIDCEESFDLIDKAIDNFYANPKSFEAVQNLVDLAFIFQDSCETNALDQDLEAVTLRYDENKVSLNETMDEHPIPGIYLGEDDDEKVQNREEEAERKVVEILDEGYAYDGFLSNGAFSGNIFSFF